jgi:mannose-6-phosphate isomerase-like protein (cupin superfamily)
VRNFLRLASGIDMQPLMLQITRQPHLWKADTYLRDYPQGPFSDVDTIFLRFPPARVTELELTQKDQHECVNMDGMIHLPAARKMVFSLMNTVEGERLGRVMINRIRPGGRIYPHADTPVHAEYWDRHHFVLQGLPGCIFRCGDEQVQMATGEVWFFRNELEHEVVNNSAADRLHLIVDIRTSHFPFKGELPTQPV